MTLCDDEPSGRPVSLETLFEGSKRFPLGASIKPLLKKERLLFTHQVVTVCSPLKEFEDGVSSLLGSREFY